MKDERKTCKHCGQPTRNQLGVCYWCLGDGRARQYEPTPDYRHLLSLEALNRLRALERRSKGREHEER